MADLTKTVSILFTFTDKNSNKLAVLSSNIDKFDKRMGMVGTSIAKAGTSMNKFGWHLDMAMAPVAQMTKRFLLFEAAVVALGVAFAVNAFNESVKFEAALLDLQKVLSDTEGSAKDYTNQVDILSLKYGESATEILKGAAEIKQAGFSVADVFIIQDAALEAAVTGQMEVSESTKILIRSLKGFKAPAEDVNRLLDLFNEVSNKNGVSLRELGNGFSKLSPVAKKLGLTYEETIALIAPIAEVFGSGTEAGNALKIALTSLVVPTGAAKDELEKMGVEIEDALTGKLRKGRDIVFDTVEAIAKLSDTQKIATISILAGKRQSARLTESLGNLVGVNKILKDTVGATGSSLKEFNIRAQASEFQINRTKFAFESMSRSIGDQFRVELTGVIVGVGDIVRALKEVTDGKGFDPLMKLIRPQLKEWSELIAGIAKALPDAFKKVDYNPMLSSLSDFTGLFSGLFSGLDLTKTEDLTKAINSVIETVGKFIDVNTGIAKVFLEVGKAISDVFDWFSSLDLKTQELIGKIGAATIVIGGVAPILTVLGLAISVLTPLIAGFISFMAGPAGLAAAFTAVTYGISELITYGLNELTKEFAEGDYDTFGQLLHEWFTGSIAAGKALDNQTAAHKRYNDKLRERKKAENELIPVMEKVKNAFEISYENQESVLTGLIGSMGAYGSSFETVDGKIKPLISSLGAILKATEGQGVSVEEVTKAYKEFGTAFKIVAGEIVPLTSSLKENTAEIEINKGALTVMQKDLLALGVPYNEIIKTTKEDTAAKKDANKELKEQVLRMIEYKIELESIQSNERVSIFEIKTKLDISEVEAGTRRLELAFNSIDNSIISTGDVILGLFNALGNVDYSDKPGLRAAIEAEEQRREKSFELLQRQLELQNQLLEKRAEIISDELKINFTLDSVEPELEAIMWNIIAKVKATANSNSADFLLGLT